MLNNEQQQAIDILQSGRNVFLTGEAGTGKSYLINHFIGVNRDKKIILCAPTGIAAININGATIHRVFGAPIGVIKPGDYNSNPSEALKRADVIIVDEISMCRRDLFDYCVNTIRKLDDDRKRQLIVVGDFYQLPPVILPEEKVIIDNLWKDYCFDKGYAFTSNVWEECDFEHIQLTEVMRQRNNNEFVDNLNKIRKGIPRAIDWFNENTSKKPVKDAISICGINETADAINLRKVTEISEEEHTFDGDIEGDVDKSDLPTDISLSLKKNMQIMTLVNNTKAGYQNGTIGVIQDILGDEIVIELKNGNICSVRPYTWDICSYELVNDNVEKKVIGSFTQLPIKPAYAVTIHKSQGQTYSAANINPECFDYGQLYVALSRVKTVESIYLEKKIHRWDLKTSDEVKYFYRKKGVK